MVDESAHISEGDLTLEPASAATSSHRRALWAVLAVIAVVTGAVVVFSSDDSSPPRLPVALGSSSREAGTSAMSADMAIAWVTYVAGKDLPALGGNARAYRLESSIDEGRVRALAEALGLQGDPTHDGQQWSVQSGDTGLVVYEDGGGAWWYSPNKGPDGGISSGGTGSVGCDPAATECASAGYGTVEPATTTPPECSEAGATCSSEPAPPECPPDAACIAPVPPNEACPTEADCSIPEPVLPPADLPTKAEAREIALDLLKATGMDLLDATVTIDGPSDAWYITVEPTLDGVPVSGWSSMVSVGSKGAINYASGTLATAKQLGEYPLIDTRAAIDRLNAHQGGTDGGPVPMGAATRDAGRTLAGGAPAPAPCPTDEPTCTTLVDPVDPTTTAIATPCKAQPDGSELCVQVGVSPTECPQLGAPADSTAINEPAPDCVGPPVCEALKAQAGDGDGGAPDTLLAPSDCNPPYPKPTPVEVVLTGAEPVLTMLPAQDGTNDVYLVPGYRFSSDKGAVVEVAAVDDASLAPTTTAPEEPKPVPVPPATEPAPAEPTILEPGQTPELGVGYYVELDAYCADLVLGDQTWRLEKGDLAGWSNQEGGTFTLDAPDHGTFVGHAAAEKTATFVPGTNLNGCRTSPPRG